MVFSFKHILIQSKAIDVPNECGVDLNYMFENFPFSNVDYDHKNTYKVTHIHAHINARRHTLVRAHARSALRPGQGVGIRVSGHGGGVAPDSVLATAPRTS